MPTIAMCSAGLLLYIQDLRHLLSENGTMNKNKRLTQLYIAFLLLLLFFLHALGWEWAWSNVWPSPLGASAPNAVSRPDLHAAVRGFSRKHLAWSIITCFGGCSGHETPSVCVWKMKNFVSEWSLLEPRCGDDRYVWKPGSMRLQL